MRSSTTLRASHLAFIVSLSLFEISVATSPPSAAMTPQNLKDCLSSHSQELSSLSDCGHHGSLNHCFSQIIPSKQEAVQLSHLTSCYINAGCNTLEADIEANHILYRCNNKNFPEAQPDHDGPVNPDLRRRRFRASLEDSRPAPVTQAPMAAATAAAAAPTSPAKPAAAPFGYLGLNQLFGRDDTSSVTDVSSGSLACFTTSSVSTSSCPLTTVDGHVSSLSCFPTQVAQSECSPGLTCTRDDHGTDICMVTQNSLTTAGTIIAIVFAAIIAIFIGTITYLCIKDRREQKRLAARAEATALARAATKKKRAAQAAEQSAPLMSQREDPVNQGGNPFAEREF